MNEQDSIYNVIGDHGSLLLKKEISILQNLKETLTDIFPDDDNIEPLSDILVHIEELFLLVIVGEVKSGKSSFVNILFGEEICKVGVTPVTDKIHILRYGEQDEKEELEPFIVEHRYPFKPLKTINIVDTPGTNSLVLEHQQITERFIPRSDLVLFITSIDRPFTQSERQFLEYIKDLWGKKIIFILTKTDIKQPEEVEEVITFIKDNCNKLLQFDPLIFPVSGKLALEGKKNNDQEALKKSKFKAIEDYIFNVLSQTDRLKLKLSGPLFTSLKIIEHTINKINKNSKIITLDTQIVEETKKIIGYEERMLKHRYTKEIDKIKPVLRDMEAWGRNFINNNLKLSNIKAVFKTKGENIKVDTDGLRPLPRMVVQTMEKALEDLFISSRSLYDQIFEILQSKFKSRICKDASRKDLMDIINDENSENIINDMQKSVENELDDLTIAKYSKNILYNSYMQLLYNSIGSLFLVLLGIFLLGNSLFYKFIGLFCIGLAFFIISVILPKLKNKSTYKFISQVRKVEKQLKVKMDIFYKQEYNNVVQPLNDSIARREQLLAKEQKNNEHEIAKLDEVKMEVKAFQSKLENLQ